jgi:hypothetical protein
MITTRTDPKMFFEIVFYNLVQDDTYNSSRLDNPVSVSFPIDFKALTFNLLQRPNTISKNILGSAVVVIIW